MKKCARCYTETIPKGRQIYCGSYKKKTGCSYAEYLARTKRSRERFLSSLSPEQKKEFYKNKYIQYAQYKRAYQQKRYDKIRKNVWRKKVVTPN